jgi:polyribonucleotide nucleotidyltransferase
LKFLQVSGFKRLLWQKEYSPRWGQSDYYRNRQTGQTSRRRGHGPTRRNHRPGRRRGGQQGQGRPGFFPVDSGLPRKGRRAGKFPGGYFKREGRPTEKEILTSRLTDRPIRPLFPKGWFNEVQVQSLLLSADGENDSDILTIIGASASLTVSDIPWDGPLGALRIGRVNGQFVANPTHAQMKESDLDLIYVGNTSDVVMFEGAAKEISEADFMAALKFGHECCQPLIQAQKELAARGGKKKRDITVSIVPDDILAEAKRLAGERMVPALLTHKKLEREMAVKTLTDEIGAKLVENSARKK